MSESGRRLSFGCAALWSRLVVKMAGVAEVELLLAAVDGGASS
jgi:hypothetical protein